MERRRHRFSVQPTGVNVLPTDFDLHILKALNRHGPLASNYLEQFHPSDSPQYTRRRLNLLTHETHPSIGGPVLFRPNQQRYTDNVLSHYLIHDLTKWGKDYLKKKGVWVDAIRPSGHFMHQVMISTTTASIELAAKSQGIMYIHGHEILEQKNATLGAMVNKIKLIPDQFFALKYPDGSYRAFVVEADRGTEPITGQNRKSYERTFNQYKKFIGEKLYKTHYGLQCGLMVLNVMSSASRMMSYLNLIPDNRFMLFQHIDGFNDFLVPPPVNRQLGTGMWIRKGHPEFRIFDY